MKPIIEVDNISKEFVIGAKKERYLSLRDQLTRGFQKKGKNEKFWALQDVSFDVAPGESLAIIGKNGAGKSTLLKILSKITPPTKGEITIRGRLASLLEVGTGFHPELTGRENIHLNGSILGLRRSEIKKQFDEIVDFSGVEAFLDTPLKRYSSGMQLRLAFAVAAHLEPEILVIDEVLAVGDSTFQQKCIDKMTKVSQSGRTILFVSHNIQAVRNLCTRGVLLQKGNLMLDAPIEQVIKQYLDDNMATQLREELDCADLPRMRESGKLRFSTISSNAWVHEPDQSIKFTIKLETVVNDEYKDLDFGVNIRDRTGQCLYHMSNKFINKSFLSHKDSNQYVFEIEKSRLKPGDYSVGFFLRANEEIHDWIPEAVKMEVHTGNVYGFNNSEIITSMVQPDFNAYIEASES